LGKRIEPRRGRKGAIAREGGKVTSLHGSRLRPGGRLSVGENNEERDDRFRSS